jgi:DNA mismatch repair ATPase MutS
MNIKPKKCKGTGKAKGFIGCGVLTPFRTYGLCMGKCYKDWLLNTSEGLKTLNKHTLKVTKPRTDLKEAIKKEKDKTKLRYLITSTINWCHKYIRLRDKGKPCISCKQPYNKNHQAGHWKKAETYSNLKFDETNIFGQCIGCNIGKDGNVQLYGDNITERITTKQKQEIERKCLEYKSNGFHWDRQQLEEIREYYKEKYNKLKKGRAFNCRLNKKNLRCSNGCQC